MLPLALFATACSRGPIVKARLDAEVDRLCTIDGGVKAYETAPLTPDLLDWAGRIWIPYKAHAKPSDKYYIQSDSRYYREGNPEVRRDDIRIVRRSDGKVMGEAIGYSRRGGDLPGPWADSSYRCPKVWNLESAIFKKREQKKE